jgi:hypothetical protein
MLSRPRAFALSTTVILGSALASGETAIVTVKALTTAPSRYANRAVTVTGRFRGRDVSQDHRRSVAPLNRSRWDFLLNAEDAAVWVSGIRPAGWDFDLDPRSAADSSRGPWLEVTGMVRVESSDASRCAPSCPRIWIEASDLRPAVSPAGEAAMLLRPASIAPAVVFHDPIDDEIDVPRRAAIRLQFSRPLMPESLSERIRISYARPQTLAAAPIPKFTALYRPDTRSVTIEFDEPLGALQTVKVELLEGITGTNGLPLPPALYRFKTAR